MNMEMWLLHTIEEKKGEEIIIGKHINEQKAVISNVILHHCVCGHY